MFYSKTAHGYTTISRVFLRIWFCHCVLDEVALGRWVGRHFVCATVLQWESYLRAQPRQRGQPYCTGKAAPLEVLKEGL